MTTPVIADVKSPFASKVNWVLLLTGLVDAANELLPLVPAQYQHNVTLAVTAIGLVLGIIAKTFYTTSVSSTSIPSVVPVSVVTHSDDTGQNQTEALNITSLALAQAAEKK